VLKIGRTNRDARHRARELGARAGYAALGPWTEIWSRAVPDAASAEGAIHRMLARHRLPRRHSTSRELFRVDVGTARQVAQAVADARPRRPSAPRPARRTAQPRRDRRRIAGRLGRGTVGRLRRGAVGRLRRGAVGLLRLVELVGLTLLALWAFGP